MPSARYVWRMTCSILALPACHRTKTAHGWHGWHDQHARTTPYNTHHCYLDCNDPRTSFGGLDLVFDDVDWVAGQPVAEPRTAACDAMMHATTGVKLLYAGFETCVGWLGPPAPKVLGSDKNSKNTSRLQMLLASHFDF